MRKAATSINFDSCTGMLSLHNYGTINKMLKEKIKKELQVKNGMINMTQVRKCWFTRSNNKRSYFSDGIVSLPIGHPNFEDVTKSKMELEEKIETYSEQNVWDAKTWKKAILNSERLQILRGNLLQPVMYYILNSSKRLLRENFNKGMYNTTRTVY